MCYALISFEIKKKNTLKICVSIVDTLYLTFELLNGWIASVV